jgi:hypothetical protein
MSRRRRSLWNLRLRSANARDSGPNVASVAAPKRRTIAASA